MNAATPLSADAPTLAAMRELLDRQAILDCLTQCARGIDRLDREQVLAAYHPDAVDDHGVFSGTAKEFFDWYEGSQGDESGTSQAHHLTNHSCQIVGDVAHAETYYLSTTYEQGAAQILTASGRYIDRLERRDGQWKIAMRYCLIEWIGQLPAIALPFADMPDVYVNGVPSRGRDDPSYRRPLINRRPAPTGRT